MALKTTTELLEEVEAAITKTLASKELHGPDNKVVRENLKELHRDTGLGTHSDSREGQTRDIFIGLRDIVRVAGGYAFRDALRDLVVGTVDNKRVVGALYVRRSLGQHVDVDIFLVEIGKDSFEQIRFVKDVLD